MSELTDGEIAMLNAARAILDAHKQPAWDCEKDEAKVAVVAELAEAGIFTYLNWACNIGGRAMTWEQLHNSPRPEEVPA